METPRLRSPAVPQPAVPPPLILRLLGRVRPRESRGQSDSISYLRPTTNEVIVFLIRTPKNFGSLFHFSFEMINEGLRSFFRISDYEASIFLAVPTTTSSP